MVGSRYLKRQVAVGVCALALAGSAAAQSRDFDVPAGDLKTALDAYAKQSGVQIIYDTDDIRGKRSPGARGALLPDDALKDVLSGTGLEVQRDASGAVAIRTARPVKLNDSRKATPSEIDVEEIVVTAQKREERLKDVPVPVTVLNAEQLADSGQVLLRNFYASVPGLSVSPNIEDTQMLSIRGITTGGFSNPTVGVVIDDVPFGASTTDGGGDGVPDIDPGDVARIEVLRGPQGTLYGDNSMGGLLKYVTKEPSFDTYGGRFEAGTRSTYNGAEPGFDLRGAINVPVAETFAIRVSGFKRQDPGYIDNAFLNLRGVNEAEADGGRLTALWRPSDIISLRVGALYQNTRSNGISEVVRAHGLGDLQQNYVAGVGGSNRTVQAYSAVFTAKLAGIDLTSLTGYNINRGSGPYDFTPYFGSSTQNGYPGSGFNGFGVTGSPWRLHKSNDKVTQEIRFSGEISETFDWLVGGYYGHDDAVQISVLTATDPTTGRFFGETYRDRIPRSFEEYAAFADVTYHVTDQFDVQIGGRESDTRVTVSPFVATGSLTALLTGQFSPVLIAGGTSKADTFTYLLTPRFKISPDFMIYARLASGFRPGGPNVNVFNAPKQYQPDKAKNYEVGVKGSLFDNKLSFDASFYYIDWKDLQLQLFTFTPPITVYGANGSGAKSEGVEVSVTSRPVDGLTISAWIAYDDAVLTQDLPVNSTAFGISGDRLPNTPRFSGSVSVEQDFPVWDDAIGFVGGQVSYTGSRFSVFNTSTSRQYFLSYTTVDLRAGVKYESWSANIFVNNAGDERGFLAGGVGYIQPGAFVITEPRTIGFSLSKTF